MFTGKKTTAADLCRKEGGYTMRVQVLGCVQLSPVDNLKRADGGSSDPFVLLKMKGQKDHKTKVVKKELNPTWEDESFEYTVKVDEGDEEAADKQVLEVLVRDKDMLSTKFMGTYIVNVSTLHTGETRQWSAELADENGAIPNWADGEERLGEVQFAITISSLGALDSAVTDAAMVKETKGSGKGMFAKLTGKKTMGADLCRKEGGYTLRVQVLGARNLIPVDHLKRADGGSSDPFVLLKMKGQKDHKTKVVKNELNPSWEDESFEYTVKVDEGEVGACDEGETADEQMLEVLVRDKDMLSTKFMGWLPVNVSELRTGETRHWYELMDPDQVLMDRDRPDRELDESCGEVQLAITLGSLGALDSAVTDAAPETTAQKSKAEQAASDLAQWLEEEAGLEGKKLKKAILRCEEEHVESVQELHDLHEDGHLRELLPLAIRNIVEKALIRWKPPPPKLLSRVMQTLSPKQRSGKKELASPTDGTDDDTKNGRPRRKSLTVRLGGSIENAGEAIGAGVSKLAYALDDQAKKVFKIEEAADLCRKDGGYTMRVQVHGARNLIPVDNSWQEILDIVDDYTTADPFVLLKMKGQKDHKTKVVKNELNPSWEDESFEYTVKVDEGDEEAADKQVLEVLVKDKDMLRTKFMGAYRVNVSKMHGSSRGWYALLDKEGDVEAFGLEGKARAAMGTEAASDMSQGKMIMGAALHGTAAAKAASSVGAAVTGAAAGFSVKLWKTEVELTITIGRLVPKAPKDGSPSSAKSPSSSKKSRASGTGSESSTKEEKWYPGKKLRAAVKRGSVAGNLTGANLCRKDGGYILRVQVLGARNLIPVDHLKRADGGSSDPFVLLKLKGQKDHKTKVVKNELNPSWEDESFEYTVTLGEGREEAADEQMLEVLVRDKDMLSTKFMGRLPVNVSTLRTGEARQWYALVDENDESCANGEVQLVITLARLYINYRVPSGGDSPLAVKESPSSSKKVLDGSPSSAKSPPKAPKDGSPSSAKSPSSSKKSRASGTGSESSTKEEKWYPGKKLRAAVKRGSVAGKKTTAANLCRKEGGYTLRVQVLGARNLIPVDHLKRADGGSSDPFVLLKMEGQKDHKTKVVKNELNPSWEDESFEYTVKVDEGDEEAADADEQMLEVFVKDKDMLSTKFMGWCPVNLSTLRTGETQQWSAALVNENLSGSSCGYLVAMQDESCAGGEVLLAMTLGRLDSKDSGAGSESSTKEEKWYPGKKLRAIGRGEDPGWYPGKKVVEKVQSVTGKKTTGAGLCRKDGGYTMRVQVLGARCLRPVDNLKRADGGSSDPFVLLKMKGQKDHKTKVVKNELNPSWEDESFEYSIHLEDADEEAADPNAQVLEVVVKDKDMMSTKFIAACSVNVSKLRIGETREWHMLVDGEGVVASSIELVITIGSLNRAEHAHSLAKEIMRQDTAAKKGAEEQGLQKRKMVEDKVRKQAEDEKRKAQEEGEQHSAASKMQSRFRGMKLRTDDKFNEQKKKHVHTRARQACQPKRGYLLKEAETKKGFSKPENVWCVLQEGIVSCYKSMEEWEKYELEEQVGAPTRRRRSFSMRSESSPHKIGVFVLSKHSKIAEFTTKGGERTPMFIMVDKNGNDGEEDVHQPTWKLEAKDVETMQAWVRVCDQNLDLLTGKTRPPVVAAIGATVAGAIGGVASSLKPSSIGGAVGLGVAGAVAGNVIRDIGIASGGATAGVVLGAAVNFGATLAASSFIMGTHRDNDPSARGQCNNWQGYLTRETETASGHSSRHKSWVVLINGIMWAYKSPAAHEAAIKKAKKVADKAAEKAQKENAEKAEGTDEKDNRPRSVSRGRRSSGTPQSHGAEDYFTLTATTHLKVVKDLDGGDTPVFVLTDTTEYEDERQPSWKLDVGKNKPDNVLAMQGWVTIINQNLTVLGRKQLMSDTTAVGVGLAVAGIGIATGGIGAAVAGMAIGIGATARANPGAFNGVVSNTIISTALARKRCTTKKGTLIKFESAKSNSKSSSVWCVLKHGTLSSFNSEEEAEAEAEKFKSAGSAQTIYDTDGVPPAPAKSPSSSKSPKSPTWFRKGVKDLKASFVLTENTKIGVIKTADVEDTAAFMLVVETEDETAGQTSWKLEAADVAEMREWLKAIKQNLDLLRGDIGVSADVGNAGNAIGAGVSKLGYALNDKAKKVFKIQEAADLCRKDGGYTLRVQVLGARNLKPVDNLKRADGGSSDPFVLLTVKGQKDHKTKVVKNELNPSWEDESFEYTVKVDEGDEKAADAQVSELVKLCKIYTIYILSTIPSLTIATCFFPWHLSINRHQVLEVLVKDKGMRKTKFLGACSVILSKMHGNSRGWYALVNEKGVVVEGLGEVELAIAIGETGQTWIVDHFEN
jgi:Ca2+-dependent lipid-binding protein